MANKTTQQNSLNKNNECDYRERSRWVFLGLPFTFTVYEVREDSLTTKKGFLNRIEDDCYMYKIQDIQLSETIAERLFGLSTLICYTGDVTDKELVLKHIRNGRTIKNYILNAAEAARIKRRTMHVNDIGVDDAFVEEV